MLKTNTFRPPRNDWGFSLIEITITVLIGIILTALAIPALTSTLQGFRTGGDAADLTSTVALAKMRAAADFTRVRLYADLSAKTFEIDRLVSGTWTIEPNTMALPLSTKVTFGFGSVNTPPSGTGTIAQAPLCYNAANTATVTNTACIVFNSRGIPIDHSATPVATDAIYVTDGSSVYGVTVSITGLIQSWRSSASGSNWHSR